MNDFKKHLLLKKTISKNERIKNGDEYKPYGKYFEKSDNNDIRNKEKEEKIILLNNKRFLDSDDDKNSEKEKKIEKKEEKQENSNKNNEDKKIIELDEEKEEEKLLVNNNEENIPKFDRSKSKYKLTIKPEYITIEKKDSIKKRIVDYSQFSNEYKSNELYNWINLVLEDWESYIKESISNKRIKSKIVSKELEKYQQCSQNVKPLITLLQERKLNQVILDKLFTVMVFAENKDLLNANDRYIDLSIGNAAWPMGLTMVGIHQRTGKSSISPAQVAYILNDETTKKYLQSIRRILSFLQIRYNIAPSESVYN
jgi:pre-mRNA-splicing factor 18